ncbi:MAG: FAD-dependent oxidoreductase, partial [Polyangiaceae bacterium]
MSATRIVIVGAGLAGASAAFALREARFDGEVTLLGQEAHPPYNRPSLSKEYLRGEDPLEALFVRPLAAYARQKITLRSGERVVAIDAVKRIVELAAGAT